MAIPRECKRLAEVDFPIAVVSKHAAREKSIRHGHPSTLHLWWARRPLASSRAMLLALLLPDPCDEHCPQSFKVRARALLVEPMTAWKQPGTTDADLRSSLLSFIGHFANWDNAANPTYLQISRSLVKAAHGDEPPLVVDPFAGGGSIPLEALRLGCEAFASDLNPVACLILKVLLEDIPRHGSEIAEELRRAGKDIKEAAGRELAEFYPPDADGARPIAYIWARTVRCEAPNCGAEIPLVRSFWLCKKPNRRRALRSSVMRDDGHIPRVDFEIFEPRSDCDVPQRNVSRARATCLCCGEGLAPERVRAQLASQLGGADVAFDPSGNRVGGARLLAVVTLQAGDQGRHYRLPTAGDYHAVWRAMTEVARLPARKQDGWSPVPDEPLPSKRGHRSIGSPRVYGMETWGDYFTARQKAALARICGISRKATQSDSEQWPAANELLSLAFSKLTELACASCRWEPVAECPRTIFTRHDLPATWDFAEGVITSDSSGGFAQVLENMISNVTQIGSNWSAGQVQSANACDFPLPNESVSVWFTDPPYYDAVAYADLSDFFFVWLKRILPGHSLLRDAFDPTNQLVPKANELTVTTVAAHDAMPKTKSFFEQGMRSAFGEGRRVLRDGGIGCVVFAHKTTEGWEALLSGLLGGGWTIAASWPITTEMGHRFNARDVAALLGSVHLVCRPRPEDAPVGDWAGVLSELPKRVGDWMERLQAEGVRGADLVFACIGPALEVYSRFSKVVDAEDREIPLGGDPTAIEPHNRGYLAYVWEAVGRAALRQVLGREEEAGAIEEDARLVALFLWTLQGTNGGNGSKDAVEPAEDGDAADEEEEDEEESPRRKPKGYTLIFDVVRRFAQPLGIHLPDWEGRIIETKKGVVRLLPVAERAKQLLGEDGAQATADRIEREPASLQLSFFPEMQGPSRLQRGRRGVVVTASDESVAARADATTLDRVHVAMLLQSSGRANALRALLAAEQERGPDFVRLANALSALYPRESEEKRLLDAMLLAVPR